MTNGNNNEGATMINRKNGTKGIDWDAQPLGREPDYRIAKRLGVAPGSVSSARKARGIAAGFGTGPAVGGRESPTLASLVIDPSSRARAVSQLRSNRNALAAEVARIDAAIAVLESLT
jgi:hypothetical protein